MTTTQTDDAAPERAADYRGFRIEPYEPRPGRWQVTQALGADAGRNVMPDGMTLFDSPAKARTGIDILIETRGDAAEFWRWWDLRLAEQHLAADDAGGTAGTALTADGDLALDFDIGVMLGIRRLAVACGLCGPGFDVAGWVIGLKGIVGEHMARRILSGPEVWPVLVSCDGARFGTLTRFRFSGRQREEFGQLERTFRGRVKGGAE